MKMHEKAMKRHTQSVTPVNTEVSYHNVREDFPVHIVFYHDNGEKTQRLVMTEWEARQLVSNLTACLVFKGQSVLDVKEEDFDKFQSRIKGLFND